MKPLLLITIFLISVTSCSEKWIMDVNPKDYEFDDDYMQNKWEQFLDLKDCQKVEYLDSIYKPIVFTQDNGLLESHFDTLLFNDNENYYYWLFREVHSITNRHPSIYQTHSSYAGTHNRQVVPRYTAERKDSLNQFIKDIKTWKDSLGCD